MINYLLAEINSGQIMTYVFLGVAVVAIIAMMVWSGKRRKKQEQEAQNLIDAVKPGNKVKTIGGICGIVVEVDSAENTFVLETGTEQSGKCFIKFDRQAIYQTDAVAEKTEQSEKTEQPAEEKEVKEESGEELITVSSEIAEVDAPEAKEEVTAEQPAEEKEETPAEKPAAKTSKKKK